MIGLVAGVLLQVQASAQARAQPGAQVGIPAGTAGRVETRVTPETVLVGKPFTVTVRARAPRGTVVAFPAGPSPDGAADVDTAGVAVRRDTIVGDEMESVVTYRLAAWRTGALPLGLGAVTLDMPDGTVTESLGTARIFVRSTLPADKSKLVPKPPRPVFPAPIDWRALARWLAAAAAAALLALAAWSSWRRRGHGAADDDGLDWAEREFRRVETMRLVERGEPERYAILMAEVVRRYLVREYAAVRGSATTAELAAVFRGAAFGGGRGFPAERILRLFGEADVLKFAAAPLVAADAGRLGAESRAVVRAIADHRPDIASARPDAEGRPPALGRAA